MENSARAVRRGALSRVSPAAAALAAIVAVAVVVGIVTYYGTLSNRMSLASAFQNRIDLQTYLGLILDEETAVRAVDATGGRYPQFLQPYANAQTRYPSLYARLRSAPYVSAADALHRRWLRNVAAPLIASPGSTQNDRLELRGKKIVDAIRADIALAQAHSELTIERTAEAARVYVLVAVGVIILFVCLIGALALSIQQRQMRERERLLRTIEERNAALERSNGALSEFAYAASHDLQEPLRTVASFTQLLQRRYGGRLDSDADEFIEFAVDGVRRMQQLIADILLYSRVTTAGTALEPVDLAAAARDAAANLRAAIEEKEARVEVEPLPRVMGDRVQLAQLLQNLIGNGLKYSAAPPVIRVSAALDGEVWRVCVADNGIGIPPEYHERIFRMFARLHTRAEYSGTGVGLALCRSIVERHGGRIWVESQEGEGATFYFTLQAVPRESAIPA